MMAKVVEANVPRNSLRLRGESIERRMRALPEVQYALLGEGKNL
jgi:hypothetical protein